MSDLPASDLAELIAEAKIRQTLARYCHTIDDGDFAALGECFVPDVVLDAFGRTRNGREAATALLAKALPPEARGKHLTGNTVITHLPAGEDGAARASVLSDFAFVSKDGSVLTGRYADEFVTVQGQWLIAKRTVALGG